MAIYTVSISQGGAGTVSVGDGSLLANLSVSAGRGPKGDGFTGGSYNGSTGVVTFTSNDGLGFATGDLRGDLDNADINGGTIDGTVIGGSTPAAISGTTGSFSGDVTISSTAPRFYMMDTNTTDGNIEVLTNSNSFLVRQTTDDKAASKNRLLIGLQTGDISFFENTGTTPKFFWDSSAERLGLGTVSPAFGIELRTVSFGDLASFRNIDGGDNHGLTIKDGSGVIELSAIFSTAAPDLTFKAGNQERLRISSNGDISFYEDTGTTPKFYWDASAESLGIGTVTPVTPLHIITSGNTAATFHSTTDNSNLVFTDASTTANVAIGAVSGNNFRIQVANAERLRITSTGSVGIGTTSPDEKLDVIGAVGVGNGTSRMSLAPNFIDAGAGNYKLQLKAPGGNRRPYFSVVNSETTGRQGAYIEATDEQSDQVIQMGAGATPNGSTPEAHLNVRSNSPLVLMTDDTERLRITSTGSVGIGTSSPDDQLEVSSSGNTLIKVTRTAAGGESRITYENSSDSVRGQVRFNWAAQAFGAFEVFTPHGASNNQRLALQMGKDFTAFNTSELERLRITSTGNVGIGGTSPFRKLDVEGGSDGAETVLFNIRSTFTSDNTATTLRFENSTSQNVPQGTAEISAIRTNSSDSGSTDLAFRTSAGGSLSERARIDASGNLLVGTTSPNPANGTSTGIQLSGATPQISVSRSGNPSGIFNRVGSDGFLILFRKDGTTVGSISVTASATAYNTSSDYRLKEDVQPMVGASDRVLSLNPVNFAWKVDGTRTDGFLAHEAQAVVPEAVTGEKDGEEMQAIDQSKLVPLLTAALQEALQKIEALEARITALEA